MSEKNPLPFAKTQSRAMLLWVLAVLIGLPLILPSATLATEILIFAMAALACNLLLGYTGLLSFGQGIFFGAGAYCAALLMLHLQMGLFTALLGAAIAGGFLALLVGALAIRRTGIYFVMLTLAFSQMAYFVAYTLSDWTGGDTGLLSVPRPEIRIGETVLLSLHSLTGQQVLTSGPAQLQAAGPHAQLLDLGNALAPGLYLLKISHGGQQTMRKIFKN